MFMTLSYQLSAISYQFVNKLTADS